MTTQTLNAYTNALSILGVPFDKVNLEGAVERIERMVAAGDPHYLVTANVDFLVQARSDVELRRILVSADLVLCDGTPLLWASSLLGNPLPERVAGSDLVPVLIRRAEEKSYRVFLLGGTPDSASAAAERVRERHPNIQLDWYSPPFNKLLEMDHDQIRSRIIAARPHLLFVSFGCPKQEKWIAMHYRDLGVPVSVGVGATVDFLANQVKRAPAWMQRNGLEWVYRLSQEPRRLAGRYSRDLFVFGTSFLRQMMLERARGFSGNASKASEFIMEGSWRFARLPENLTSASLATLNSDPFPTVPPGLHCLLDASGVRRLDATGVAALVRYRKVVRSKGGAVVLVASSSVVTRLLRFAKADELFEFAADTEIVRNLIVKSLEFEPAVRHQSTVRGFKLFWRGEVTAANAEVYWKTSSAIIDDRLSESIAFGEVELDLSEVSFLDSTGLGILVRLRRAAGANRASLKIEGLQPSVLNVIRLAQLERFLLGESGRRAGSEHELIGMVAPRMGNPA